MWEEFQRQFITVGPVKRNKFVYGLSSVMIIVDLRTIKIKYVIIMKFTRTKSIGIRVEKVTNIGGKMDVVSDVNNNGHNG